MILGGYKDWCHDIVVTSSSVSHTFVTYSTLAFTLSGICFPLPDYFWYNFLRRKSLAFTLVISCSL